MVPYGLVGTLIVHLEAWPLFITVLPTSLTLADLEPYMAEVMQLYPRRERFASLIDTRPLRHLPGAAERKRLGDWQNDTVDLIARYNVCTGTVIASPVFRGALTAMNWIFRPPNEQFATATFEEAFQRCVQRLVEDGRPVDPALVRLAKERPPGSAEDVLRAISGAAAR